MCSFSPSAILKKIQHYVPALFSAPFSPSEAALTAITFCGLAVRTAGWLQENFFN
jgi:hypothetical protein